MINEFLEISSCDQKNVITQILQNLYNFISTLRDIKLFMVQVKYGMILLHGKQKFPLIPKQN